MSKPNSDHVVMGNNEMVCDHCGEAQAFPVPIDVRVLCAMAEAFTGIHATCAKSTLPRCGACRRLGHATEDHVYKGPYEWLNGHDTGLSSKAIWNHMMGRASTGDAPRDPDDFGRCHRLLVAFPEWRARIREMSAFKQWEPQWAGLAPAWDELEALYVAGDGERLYARMRELRGEK